MSRTATQEHQMRPTTKTTAGLLALLVVSALLFLGVAPVAAQAADSNCPPGQPLGRPPGTPPNQPGPPTGRPSDYPPGRCQLALSRSAAQRNETFTATGGGFIPGEEVTLSVAGRNVQRVIADANGAFAVDLAVPEDAPFGATKVLASGATQQLSADFEVLAGASAGADASPARARAGGLVRTGSDAVGLASAGLSLVVVGGVLVMIVRRRRAAIADGVI